MCILAVYILCLGARIYFISEKEDLHGDEISSFILAFNNTGWGENSYKEGIAYTKEELQQNLFIDDKGGWEGYIQDLKALWLDNRDSSHASLYYMLLRTALIGQDKADQHSAINRGCGLNLVIFSISFLILAFLLVKNFSKYKRLFPVFLFAAFFNPISVSTSLFIREYQIADMFFIAFCLLSTKIFNLYKDKKQISYQLAILYAFTISAFVSVGYFNAIYVCLTVVVMVIFLAQQKEFREIRILLIITLASLFICKAMYSGFFNFIIDDRTNEIGEKLSGTGILSNLYYSGSGLYRIFIKELLGYGLTITTLAIIVFGITKKTKIECMPKSGIFYILIGWIIIITILSTWKLNRYISAGIPMVMIFIMYYLLELSKPYKLVCSICVLAAMTLHTTFGDKIEYLTQDIGYFPTSNKIFLYATYDGDRNTLSLIAPHMRENQECIIISNLNQIKQYTSDTIVYIFADKQMSTLLQDKHFTKSQPFNTWQDLYIFNEK